MTPRRLLCLHGHFYQPPRENPWIEEVEVQDSAAPFHDWNERITAECYAPNAAARVKGPGGRIADIVNNYLHISFNFGPSLMTWLARHARYTYELILEADARSRERRGHGNAIAQGWSHAILPLASPRDRVTQIRWGIADFRQRFGRDPEGFWCPETAVDADTLRALADEGIRFTVLSPLQAHRVRPVPPAGPADEAAWQDAQGGRFDPTRVYRAALDGGRELALFFYDGPIARGLAFGGGLANADDLVAQLESGFDPGRDHLEVLSVAVDGETFGHHRKGGDETLATALRRIESRGDLKLINYGQALDLAPPEWEAEVIERSSWSCAHGVERWRSDCGCEGNGQPGWRQAWRAPLRDALDRLRDRLSVIFDHEGSRLFEDPLRAREDYIQLVLAEEDGEHQRVAAFLARQAGRTLFPEEEVAALQLLEMERQAQLMYSSCGWFFAEISGLESVQILKYAARAVQLAREASGVDLEPLLRDWLARAPSNIPEMGDGRRAYDHLVTPSVVTLEGVAAHLAITSLFDEPEVEGRVFCYRYRVPERRRETNGAATLSVSRLQLESIATGSSLDVTCCVLHFGGADFRCGLRPYSDAADQAELVRTLFSRLERLSLAQVVREIDRAFTGRDYTLRDLFLDGRRRLTRRLLEETLARCERDYLRIFEENLRLMVFLREIDSPIPTSLRVAADVGLSRQLEAATVDLCAHRTSVASAHTETLRVMELAGALGARLDKGAPSAALHRCIEAQVDALVTRGERGAALDLIELVELAERIGVDLDLWAAQNRVWDWAKTGGAQLDVELLRRLAARLYFDESALLRRAGGARDQPQAPTQQ